MTDYDELRREAEALLLLREEKPTEAPYSPLEQRMASLITRLLPALEDAQRYRWLRQRREWPEIFVGVDSEKHPNKWALMEEEADTAIDAALKEANRGQ